MWVVDVFRGSPPYSFVSLLSTLYLYHWEQKKVSEHDDTTAMRDSGTVFLGLKASPLRLQTYLLSLWTDSSIFFSSDHKT